MPDLETILNSPVILKHKGKDYPFSPLGLGKLVQLKKIIIDHAKREAKEVLEISNSPDLVKEVKDELAQTIRRPFASRFILNKDILAEIVFLCLQQYTPDITREQVLELATPENTRLIESELFGGAEKNPPVPETKTPA